MTIAKKPNGVAIVTLDAPGEKMNTLNEKLMRDFESTLETIGNDEAITSVVIVSGKKDCWIAGADIKMLDACQSEAELKNLVVEGQKLINRLANSPKPVVAAIDGSCLGGGLEVALACHYRIATSNPKTAMALPEVMLGLLPGTGGTQRLPATVGLVPSLDMALTGKTIKADRAKKMGLVHGVADPNALEHAAVMAAEQLASGALKPTKRKVSWMTWAMEGPLKSMVFSKAKEGVTRQSGGHYPAPYAILDCIKTGWESGFDQGSKAEQDKFAKLGMTTESKALRGIFFGQTALKKNKYGEPSRKPQVVSILGAGLMGAGIAQVSAVQGKYDVILKDKDAKGLYRGVGQIHANLSSRVKKKAMSSFDRDKMMSNIMGLTDDSPSWREHLKRTDLLVEAVFEDLGVKHKVIGEMESILPEHAIIATNTSAIPIAEIAKGSKRPERVIGMHYFSPVDKMPLLEIIPHSGTDKDVLAAAMQVGLKQGKTVISVKDVPGFYINRCLGPFLAEVMALVLQGVPLPEMDKAMRTWGMPVGPITLADEVGIDVANHLQYNLKELGVRMASGSDQNLMQVVVDKGFLGKKTGKGFYLHDAKNKKGPKVVNPEIEAMLKQVVKPPAERIRVEEMQERVSHRLMNEAIMCLQDGIIANAVDGDMGMVFGIGFPPFKGVIFTFTPWIDSWARSSVAVLI